jgi:hypothetical protein
MTTSYYFNLKTNQFKGFVACANITVVPVPLIVSVFAKGSDENILLDCPEPIVVFSNQTIDYCSFTIKNITNTLPDVLKSFTIKYYTSQPSTIFLNKTKFDYIIATNVSVIVDSNPIPITRPSLNPFNLFDLDEINFGKTKLTSLAIPTDPSDLISKNYVDNNINILTEKTRAIEEENKIIKLTHLNILTEQTRAIEAENKIIKTHLNILTEQTRSIEAENKIIKLTDLNILTEQTRSIEAENKIIKTHLNILTEQTRAIEAENKIIKLIHHSKSINPHWAVKNITGAQGGSLPMDMPDKIAADGYDGWFYQDNSVNFINWSFYSKFDINNKDSLSVSFNIKLLSSTNIPSLAIYTAPIAPGSLYYNCLTYSISDQDLQKYNVQEEKTYTFYIMDVPPQIAKHTAIPLTLMSITYGTNEIPDEDTHKILNFSIFTNIIPTNIIYYKFIISQFAVISKYGNENMLLTNDSLHSLYTRSKFDNLSGSFYETISNSSAITRPGYEFCLPKIAPFKNQYLKFTGSGYTWATVDRYYYTVFNKTFNPVIENSPISFAMLLQNTNLVCAVDESMSIFKLTPGYNYKIQFSTDCVGVPAGEYYIMQSQSPLINTNVSCCISNIYSCPPVSYCKAKCRAYLSTPDNDVYICAVFLGPGGLLDSPTPTNLGTFGNSSMKIHVYNL